VYFFNDARCFIVAVVFAVLAVVHVADGARRRGGPPFSFGELTLWPCWFPVFFFGRKNLCPANLANVTPRLEEQKAKVLETHQAVIREKGRAP
jgi:hypothetical protein